MKSKRSQYWPLRIARLCFCYGFHESEVYCFPEACGVIDGYRQRRARCILIKTGSLKALYFGFQTLKRRFHANGKRYSSKIAGEAYLIAEWCQICFESLVHNLQLM